MATIKPALKLECHECHRRWPPSAVMESVKLHFEVEHPEVEQVNLDLVAVCTCNLRMMPAGTTQIDATTWEDLFLCGECGNTGTVRRGPT